MVVPSKRFLSRNTKSDHEEAYHSLSMGSMLLHFLPFEIYWRNVWTTVLQLSVLCTYKNDLFPAKLLNICRPASSSAHPSVNNKIKDCSRSREGQDYKSQDKDSQEHSCISCWEGGCSIVDKCRQQGSQE